MGAGLKSGTIAWPANDEPMRLAAKKQLEISLFKDLLKVRWNDMTPSDAPRFTTNISYIPGYIEKNKNYWIYYYAGKQKDLFGKEKDGNYETPHWLGRGGTIFNHKQPDDRIAFGCSTNWNSPRKRLSPMGAATGNILRAAVWSLLGLFRSHPLATEAIP